MSSQPIIFFDLASKDPCQAWSLNPWKTRFALNYKGLNYETKFLEYPDLKPTLIEHFPKDQDDYTSPTVKMPDGTWIMDSKNIAAALEEKYPERSLHLDSPLLPRVYDTLSKVASELLGVYMSLVPFRLLNDVNLPYWRKTREPQLGMTLEELGEKRGGEDAYEKAAPGLKEATAMLKEDGSGPYFMGKTVSYADFVWAGFLIFFQRVGEAEFQSVLKASGDPETHLKLLEALKPWSERNDH